jgi:hypothetical protein
MGSPGLGNVAKVTYHCTLPYTWKTIVFELFGQVINQGRVQGENCLIKSAQDDCIAGSPRARFSGSARGS